jgi:hypothetical protein
MAENKVITVSSNNTIDEIQSALRKSGYTIKFTKGIYNITKTLRLYSNTTIILDGCKLVRKVGSYVFFTHADENTTKYNGQHDIIIQGGIIVANGCNKISNIVSIVHANNITIKKLTILKNVGNHAIEINSSQNVLIDGCSFLGNIIAKGGEFREAIQIDFSASFSMTYEPNKNAKCYDDTHCQNIMISNSKFKGFNVCIGTHTQTRSKNKHKNIQILHNTVFGIGSVRGYGSAFKILNMENVLIEDNTVSGFARFVEIVSSNRFYSTNGNITTLKPSYITGSLYIKIIKNTVKNPSTDFTASGVYIDSKFKDLIHDDILIENNIFELKNGKSKYPILVRKATNVVKNNNRCDI